MKTKTFASLLALASATCAAQEAAPEGADPVNLYGRVYAVLESVETRGGTTATLPRRTRVTDQSSLLGVRGSESLGGGLSATFQFETGFAPDAASGTFAARNSAVGLAHKQFGTLIMGRWDMPFKSAMVAPLDPFTDLALADITGTAINQGNFSNREPNVVEYWSPNWGGFEVKLGYAVNEGRDATRNPSKQGASLVWSSGNVYLAYAYEKHKDSRDGTATAGVDEVGNGVGGYVRLGGAKLMAQYGTYTRTGTAKQKSYALGIDWVFAENHHVLVIYQNSKDGGILTAAQPSCHMYGVGWRYDFSKRTFITLYYTDVQNEVGNLCNFGSATLAVAAGQDPRGLSLGMRHTF